MGFSLNEYGLRVESTGQYIEGIFSEKDIYDKLNLPYKEPWQRN